MADSIRLELPAHIQDFKFTFEKTRPGWVTVEIALRGSLKRPRSTETQKPAIVNRWLEAQKVYQVSTAQQLANTEALVVEAISKENITVGHHEHTAEAVTTMTSAPLVDNSETEPESDIPESPEPATPAEFTRWILFYVLSTIC
ncbi:uncharacterized protein EDB91DRAFT_1085338 [Suillus paluster]|uniref:uncharacterized protein n=1 Tax=Suillus paluster TaxID=48578 RepID=UPI001B87B9DB|nr:uncharacterized protein EDB91DRAFT_1085338 [Suillus paluster]KAG1730658.1 hypothetical protein EDB91DRAFT_1085338 [Suillus paluster]